jgi:hypothetical protein
VVGKADSGYGGGNPPALEGGSGESGTWALGLLNSRKSMHDSGFGGAG